MGVRFEKTKVSYTVSGDGQQLDGRVYVEIRFQEKADVDLDAFLISKALPIVFVYPISVPVISDETSRDSRKRIRAQAQQELTAYFDGYDEEYSNMFDESAFDIPPEAETDKKFEMFIQQIEQTQGYELGPAA